MRILVITFLLFLPCNVFASKILHIDGDFKRIRLGSYLDISEDKTGKVTFKDIKKKFESKSFFNSNKELPSFGFTKSAYWTRFTFKNTFNKDKIWYLNIAYSLINHIDIYILHDDTLIKHIKSGSSFPFHHRLIDNNDFTFRILQKANSTYTFYVRLKTNGLMNLFLTAYSPEEFIKSETYEHIAFGLFYGAIIILLFYNLFLYVSLRQSVYLYYILYYTTVLFFHLIINGFAYQFLWPNATWWGNNSVPIFYFLGEIFVIQFSIKFLDTKFYIPRIHTVLITIMVISMILLPLTFVIGYFYISRIAILISLVLALILTIASVMVFLKGHRQARFYTMAWVAFWISIIMYYLRIFSILPNNLFTIWFQQIASLIEMILISFGLADKINFIKNDLETLNLNLENIIETRTKELYFTIDELEKKDREMQIELELAGDIQQGIIPHVPAYHEGVKIEGYYNAMNKVGGDFFDIFHMQGGYLGILIADASGHGMPAAFITALAKISFSEVIQGHLFPADIFANVNEDMVDTIKTDDFLTAFLLVISPNFEVFYCNASHQKAMVLRKDEMNIEEWDTNGLFIGALTEAASTYEDKQDILQYGDRVLLYTDGIVEAKNTQMESFGMERLKKIFLETSFGSLEAVKEKIIHEILDFTGEKEQFDDITFVIIEIDPLYRYLFKYRDQGFKLLGDSKPTEAIEVLQKALDINPKDDTSHLYIGECYLQKKEYEKAVIHFQQYLNNNEYDANVWHHLGEAYFSLKDYDKSYRTSQKAIQLKNNFIDAMIVCAFSLQHLDRRGEAKEYWQKILQHEPENKIAQIESNKE